MNDALRKALLRVDDLFELYWEKEYNRGNNTNFILAYDEFINSPNELFDYKSPKDVMNEVTEDEVIDLFKEAVQNQSVPLLLRTKILDSNKLFDVFDYAIKSKDDCAGEAAISIMMSTDWDVGYIFRLFEANIGPETNSMCCNCLSIKIKEGDKLVSVDRLIEIGKTDPELALYVGDVIRYAPMSDEIYKFLTGLLNGADNPRIQMVAPMLASYGDQRAAAVLYPLLDTCDYPAYCEVRNAIEALGGTVDDNYRDFSRDSLYKTIREKSERYHDDFFNEDWMKKEADDEGDDE